jgi:hypothetical protein
MEWGLFGQIVLFIIINAFAKTFVKCVHNAHCKTCKQP